MTDMHKNRKIHLRLLIFGRKIIRIIRKYYEDNRYYEFAEILPEKLNDLSKNAKNIQWYALGCSLSTNLYQLVPIGTNEKIEIFFLLSN